MNGRHTHRLLTAFVGLVLLVFGVASVGALTIEAPSALAATTKFSFVSHVYDGAAKQSRMHANGLQPQAGAGAGIAGQQPTRVGQGRPTSTTVFAAEGGGSLSDLFANGAPKASDLSKYAEGQGWKASQTATGPLKYTDENGVVRVTIKRGSARTPGSEDPHVELRGADGQRIDPNGNPVTRNSPGNHTLIDWDGP